MERLAIAHVLAPNEVGGLEQVVRGLAIGQMRSGHDIRVIASGVGAGPHAFLESLGAEGVVVERSPFGSRAYLRERAWFAGACRRHDFDVVHTHGLRTDALHLPVARRLGIPGVSTVHGITRNGWKSWLHHELEWRALRRADAVVAVSRPLVDSLAKLGIRRERIEAIPNAYCGAELLSRAEARTVLGIPAEGFVVGWTGRLSVEKAADVVIDALAELRDVALRVSFLGDGIERDALRKRAASTGVAASVRWHGAVPNAGRLMQAFDVFALSSRTEGTPLALLEAIAAGVPVVATAVGGVPDIVSEDEAFLVPPDDPRALAAALRTVAADANARAARAAAAKRRLECTFRVEPWLDCYERVYRRIVARRRVAAVRRRTVQA